MFICHVTYLQIRFNWLMRLQCKSDAVLINDTIRLVLCSYCILPTHKIRAFYRNSQKIYFEPVSSINTDKSKKLMGLMISRLNHILSGSI